MTTDGNETAAEMPKSPTRVSTKYN